MKSLALVFGLCAGIFARDAAAKGRLAVVIVIDQMRADELTGLAAGYSGGLAQLLDQGEVYTHAMHTHGVLETASGHATLATAALPCSHGVLDQRLFDRDRNELRGICDFVAQPPPQRVEQRAGEPGSCDAAALLVPTLGERLKAASPRSQVAAFAAKARSANLMAGQMADVVAWTYPWQGRAQVKGRSGPVGPLPAWVLAASLASPVAQSWNLPKLPGSWVHGRERRAGISADLCRHGATFPHVFGQAAAPTSTALKQPPALWPDAWGASWLCSPDSDRLIVDLAVASLSEMNLGKTDATDLLWVSLGATDFVGHAFGYESLERAAILASVDQAVGRLMRALVAHRGPQASPGFELQVILTADHGIGPRLDTAQALGLDAVGVAKEPAQRAISSALFGLTTRANPYILRAPWVYLTEPDPLARQIQAEAVAKALIDVDGIAQAATAKDLLGHGHDADRARLRASWHEQRGGDVAVMFTPGSRPVHDANDLTGAWHGGQSESERHVPFVRWGDGVDAQYHAASTSIVERMESLGLWLGLKPKAPKH